MAEERAEPINPDTRFTNEHEWVLLTGEIATVGISDYAQSELGEIVYVSLPEVGKILQQNESLGEVESVKAVSDIYSPVSGEVVDVNQGLKEAPELVNSDPQGEGWMVRIKISNQEELKNLMNPDEYRAFLDSDDSH